MPPSSVKLIPRDVPLPVVRVASMFVKAANRDQDKMVDAANDHGSFIEKVCIFLYMLCFNNYVQLYNLL